MNKTSKIVISVLASFVVLMIYALLAAATSASGGHVPGLIGLILFGGLYYGLKAMWKDGKKDDNNNNSDNSDNTSILQK